MRISGNAVFLGRRGNQRIYKAKTDVYWWNGSAGHYDSTLGGGKYDRKGPVMHRPGEVVS